MEERYEDNLVIHIYEASEGGYMYDIYNLKTNKYHKLENCLDGVCDNGGFCGGSLEDSLEAASDLVFDVLGYEKERSHQIEIKHIN
jgi:hypothetical protein